MKTKSTSASSLLFLHRLDTLFFRLSPTEPTPTVQLLTGTEQNYKAQIEVKFGDKTLLLSTGSSPSSPFFVSILTPRSADRCGSLSCHVLRPYGISPSAASSQQHCVEPSIDHRPFERVLHQRHFRARSSVPRNPRGNPSLGRAIGLLVIDRCGTSSACI